MVKITGFTELQKKLRKLANTPGMGEDVEVTVGYTKNYAVYVHENLETNHIVGEAKYLEKPARLLSKKMAAVVVTITKQTGSLIQGLLTAGRLLQRESQDNYVPVRTGDLKGSAFTKRTK